MKSGSRDPRLRSTGRKTVGQPRREIPWPRAVGMKNIAARNSAPAEVPALCRTISALARSRETRETIRGRTCVLK